MDNDQNFDVTFGTVRNLTPDQLDQVGGGGLEATIWLTTSFITGTETTIATTATTWE